MIHHRQATLADCVSVAERIRDIDRIELSESLGHDNALWVLREGIALSRPAHTLCHDKLPLAVMGVVPLSPGVGLVWMVSTTDLAPVARRCVPLGKLWCAARGQDYPILMNYVHPLNTAAKRWLTWMGFSFPGHRHPRTGHELFLRRNTPCAIL